MEFAAPLKGKYAWIADENFSDILLLASQICDTPMAAIALTDNNRTRFIAASGLEPTEFIWDIPAYQSFCIKNTLSDESFCNHPLVKNAPLIRFYAGIPLVLGDGSVPGHICVMDTRPGDLTGKQLSGLQAIAANLVTLIDLGSRVRTLQQNEELSKSNQDLMEKLDKQQAFYENILNKI